MSKRGATDTKLGLLARRVFGDDASVKVEHHFSDHGSFYTAVASGGSSDRGVRWEARCSDDSEDVARGRLMAALLEALHE